VSKLVGKKAKPLENAIVSKGLSYFRGGERGIRTLEGLAPLTVFETAPFNHSGTSPFRKNTGLAGPVLAMSGT
jgi:hypothetical protein